MFHIIRGGFQRSGGLLCNSTIIGCSPHKQQHRGRPEKMGIYIDSKKNHALRLHIVPCCLLFAFAGLFAESHTSAHLPARRSPSPAFGARHCAKDACALQNMGILMQNMGEAAETAAAAAAGYYYQGVELWWREGKSHRQAVHPWDPRGLFMDDFMAACCCAGLIL